MAPAALAIGAPKNGTGPLGASCASPQPRSRRGRTRPWRAGEPHAGSLSIRRVTVPRTHGRPAWIDICWIAARPRATPAGTSPGRPRGDRPRRSARAGWP
ncbi:Hypothetical protein A7982_09687 [Minicystis rosea]|nr:Hypothetical protein A7982_09687 [Minicystis rosea]